VPENSVAPSQPDANPTTRPTAKAQVIPLDTTSKSMSLFVSEKAPETKTAKSPVERTSPVDTGETPRAAVSTPDVAATRHSEKAAEDRAPRITLRGSVVALLAIAVIAQGGYIAYDMYRGSLAVAPELGSVSVTSEPTGAPVLIDGVARGTTPLQIALAPGAHDVQVGSGPQARSQPVTVTAGSTSSLHLGLGSSPGIGSATGTGGLQIATEPPGARVSIDGTPHGVAPVTVTNLKVGDHVVTVRGNSGDAVNRTVAVQEGTVASLLISMTAPGGIAAGWLAISSDVPLQILERGTILGTTESPRILLPTGNHELELVNAELGYRVTRTVQIAAGQTASVALKPPMGTISINAVPWAEVSIDGQRVGETPIGNFAVTIGRHEVLFRHPELGEQRRSVTVGVTNPVRISADMRKR
jgi:hypothetical protein